MRRARPLARRRAMTLRPFLVLMRFRNPCSRLRLRFEGCLKVNDIAHSFSRDHFSMKRPHYRGVTGGCQSIYDRISAWQWGHGNPKCADRVASPDTQKPAVSPVLEALLPDCGKDATGVTRLYHGIFHHNSLFSKGIDRSPPEESFWHLHCVEKHWLDATNDLHAIRTKKTWNVIRALAAEQHHMKLPSGGREKTEELAGPAITR
ncbi:MAG: hypothetical protein LZF60_150012 [Nitrospira sp.]|nr:MAG: hypothetical protein LZF60_150012 [Nitrospira sp.]